LFIVLYNYNPITIAIQIFKMCKLCSRQTCLCLPGRPTAAIVKSYIQKLNNIIDKHSLTLHEDEVNNIINLRRKLMDWEEHKHVDDFDKIVLKSTILIYKYIF
jgi:hypothetical protein